MIGFLIGKPVFFNDYVLVQTAGGVGYKVWVSAKILAQNEKDEIKLFIHSYIKEDRFELYGFLTAGDLQLFEMLLSVSGCGPKMALAICEAGSERIVEAIKQANVSFFAAFPRVGKKVAQKLIIELKTKLGGLKDLDLAPKSQNYQDAYEALMALGVPETKVETELAKIDLETMSVAAAVKTVLKDLKK